MEVKTVVMASLTLTEKIFQHKKVNPEILGLALTSAFVSKDDGIQSKAAKIILKYIPPSEAVKESLSHYSDNILTNVRSLLETYIEEKPQELEAIVSEKYSLLPKKIKSKYLKVSKI
jgi:hypothetical protein